MFWEKNSRRFFIQLPESLAKLTAEFALISVKGSDKISNTLTGVVLMTRYGMEYPGTKEKTPMKVDEMVQKWVAMLKLTTTVHTKDEMDAADFDMDDLYGPLLSCPVAQLREFCEKLSSILEADPSVPYVVWRTFDVWKEDLFKNEKDTAVVRLRTSMAKRIAQRVEGDVQGDIVGAMVGALKWRGEEELKAVEEQLDRGAKPRVRGRESCLFLEVGKGKQKKTVML